MAEPNVDDGVDVLIEKKDEVGCGQVKKVVYQYEMDRECTTDLWYKQSIRSDC